MSRFAWVASDIRSDLLPELEARFGEIFCPKIRESPRLLFKFRSEESALCGQTVIQAYIDQRNIPARTAPPEDNAVVLIIGQGDDL